MMTPIRPTFRTMDREESEGLLGRNHVGRIAFAVHDQVNIEPIHFVYADGMIHGRTSPGTKVDVLQHVPWIAFEADEVEDVFKWKSVVVRGTFFVLDASYMAAEHARTLELMRAIVPETLTSDDPTPQRNVLFRIDVREITGRAAELR